MKISKKKYREITKIYPNKEEYIRPRTKRLAKVIQLPELIALRKQGYSIRAQVTYQRPSAKKLWYIQFQGRKTKKMDRRFIGRIARTLLREIYSEKIIAKKEQRAGCYLPLIYFLDEKNNPSKDLRLFLIKPISNEELNLLFQEDNQ
ncbi:MAG: hypothetical protein ACXADY_02940 [Candidatus Hodarchaeales archaeon]|jgi:hypothetical protein